MRPLESNEEYVRVLFACVKHDTPPVGAELPKRLAHLYVPTYCASVWYDKHDLCRFQKDTTDGWIVIDVDVPPGRRRC